MKNGGTTNGRKTGAAMFLRLLPWFSLGSSLSSDPGRAIGAKI
tara:strand:- start:4336 stop:4464 length:129 start_codon:yes stop_codon:yes gene_type:complete